MAAAITGIALPAAAEERLDFHTRILPILTKAGCNTGNCHGAAVGQGGFKLSLLGYDPAQDHSNLTRERGGRRIDSDSPASSLFLRKATEDLDHEGGRRIKPDSAACQTLVKWIGKVRRSVQRVCRSSRLKSNRRTLCCPRTGQTAQLRVTATLSDGRREDVTALALYSSNDDAVAEVKQRAW